MCGLFLSSEPSNIDVIVSSAKMAILSAPQDAQPIDVAAWTEQATAAMSTVTISAPGDAAPVTTVSVQIPLDDVAAPTASATRPTPASAAAREGGNYMRKEPIRRDSLKRREALLKGKEGSRRRMRWENGMSLGGGYTRRASPTKAAIN